MLQSAGSSTRRATRQGLAEIGNAAGSGAVRGDPGRRAAGEHAHRRDDGLPAHGRRQHPRRALRMDHRPLAVGLPARLSRREPQTILGEGLSILLPPLEQTLQLRPVPELVWRIALVRHYSRAVEVSPGDRIVVSIVSATQECLINDDDRDLYCIFGGNRSRRPTRPMPARATRWPWA